MSDRKVFLPLHVGTMLLLVIVLAAAVAAAEERMLYSFTNHDGYHPKGRLAQDAAGNLYGTTVDGGAYFRGTVFQLTPNSDGSWSQKILHSFSRGSDGQNPISSVIVDAAGNVYGTTCSGGANGNGTVFELSSDDNGNWTKQLLYTFGAPGDGSCPEGLTFDSGGNLYGITFQGGSQNWGIAYQLTLNASGFWTEKILHNFGSGRDGKTPRGSLISDDAGNLYGVTEAGGSRVNDGVVFELSPNPDGTWTERVVHNFGSGNDGAIPEAGLVADDAGHLYGTTFTGGAHERGVVFELTPNANGGSTETVLHHFGYADDGQSPWAELTLDDAGDVYGTTLYGGAHGFGTVFMLTPNPNGGSTETVLHHFGAGRDGQNPESGMIWDRNGKLAGTAQYGGVHHYGAVFEVTQ